MSLYKLPKLTDRTVTAVAALPRLETLSLRCTGKITDQGLAGLAAARNLKTLHLDYARNLTGDGLLRLARALPLEELAVDSSPHLTDDHLMQLITHPTLKARPHRPVQEHHRRGPGGDVRRPPGLGCSRIRPLAIVADDGVGTVKHRPMPAAPDCSSAGRPQGSRVRPRAKRAHFFILTG